MSTSTAAAPTTSTAILEEMEVVLEPVGGDLEWSELLFVPYGEAPSELGFGEAWGPEVPVGRSTDGRMGVRLLGVNPDRSFVVEVSVLTQDDQGVLQVDLTASWYAADGEPLGVAPLPLEEQLVHVPHPAVVGDDGYVYYLLTRREQVEVYRLAWNAP